ncbi:unnamed protein product [Arctia plantaginis]|uniref:Uncharacterized protein n=1 Tax=Arctia plantaginis TaxID=874455 RepID=A0A8S0ZK17_ARCPL|nr:unnamed protein product [Arctia plantaginis]
MQAVLPNTGRAEGRRVAGSTGRSQHYPRGVGRAALAQDQKWVKVRCVGTVQFPVPNTRSRAVRATRATCGRPARAPMEHAPLAELARPGASPGLLRRRYSVPETIMRKYRLAQQRSDSEESVPATSRSAASASPTPADAAHRFARRDRELMRKSALLRRMWGRADCRGCCCCSEEPAPCSRETRSLDGSRSELRHLSSGLTSSRYSQAVAGWATPKRQRLETRDFRGSDEMLRAAMRNSYDRAEESRDRAALADLSDSTYRSHAGHRETLMDPFTDSDASKCDDRSGTPGKDVYTQYSERHCSDTATQEIKFVDDTYVNSELLQSQTHVRHISDEQSVSSSSDTFTASLCTAKDALASVRSRPVDLNHNEHGNESISKRGDHNLFQYHEPLAIETAPSYEVLEIVVSESLNTNSVPTINAPVPTDNKRSSNTQNAPPHAPRRAQNINIDEYVSNILVESLNSLSDQLECMSATIGSDRKISIVEKEIKVKLQNTGVNTIVHLSPTSNNQIIFGNEELCNKVGSRDSCNNAITIREEESVESNNNVPDSAERCPCESFDIHHDNVNQAVLQQIQKLFQDELNGAATANCQNMPEISHIEISDVDVFLNNAEAELAAQDERSSASHEPCQYEVISSVGACNYYLDTSDNPVVPRFSALPHTDSMEVNTSSSEDADVIGSDCTSLVDSLDDPNSPRSVLLRKAFSNRRGELVRSAIDVLDLLPENACNDITPREKPESFFIGIKDNGCDCDKENINVADRMPEKIKQRLYRRHRKRELRMECARRTRNRQQRREIERDRAMHRETYRSQREVERDCIAIVNALIDDVIAKIAQDEYRCMRIKHRPIRVLPAKTDINVSKRTWKKEVEPIYDREPFKAIKNGCVRFDTKEKKMEEQGERHQIHGKLSLRPKNGIDDRTSKRIYQKSEIHEGNKCIEILEILEYVNGSQSSPDNTNSDENQNQCTKHKKSRIPVPISERLQRPPNNGDFKRNNNRQWLEVTRGAERNENTNRLITDMLLGALVEHEGSPPPRRASVPASHEPRERVNSLRFRQVFDIIPEERSSISLDSATEDVSHNRRASAPDIIDEYRVEEPSERECEDIPPAPSPLRVELPDDKIRHSQPTNEAQLMTKNNKCAATSPMNDVDADKRRLRSKHQTTMTSPNSKSAATSPMRASPGVPMARGRGWAASSRLSAEGVTEKNAEPAKLPLRRSVTTQCEARRTVAAARAERRDRGERHKRAVRADRRERVVVQPPRRPPVARSQSYDNIDNLQTTSPEEHIRKEKNESREKLKTEIVSLERSKEETIHPVKLPDFKGGGNSEGVLGVTSSDSSESGSSLLCPLAPRWLAPAPARARRAARRRAAPHADPADLSAAPDSSTAQAHEPKDAPGAWSVTVAGSCRAALPADVEMRLRFPHERDAPLHATTQACQDCTCSHCAACSCSARTERVSRAPPLPPPAAPGRLARSDGKLTLTMKKEALDSSILASKSSRKSSAQLPDVETYRASRTRLRSSVKTRRGYSLHCWLPDNEDAPIRARNGLSVLGCAIIPELKPRVPTMSERDLTRMYTPRHYLRS